MLLFSLLSCLHRPAVVAPPIPWRREVDHREEVLPDGSWCAWDAERIVTAEGSLWEITAPDTVPGGVAEQWCPAGGEASRTVDVVDQTGPFLHTILHDRRCCPEEEVSLCVTWDLRTRGPATLSDVDPRRAAELWAGLQAKIAAEPALADLRFAVDEFVMEKGIVRFCGRKDGTLREVEIR